MRQLILPLIAFWTSGMTACEEGPQPDIYNDAYWSEVFYNELTAEEREQFC